MDNLLFWIVRVWLEWIWTRLPTWRHMAVVVEEGGGGGGGSPATTGRSSLLLAAPATDIKRLRWVGGLPADSKPGRLTYTHTQTRCQANTHFTQTHTFLQI